MDACYAARRARLLESLSSGLAIIPTAPERHRNGDASYPYRFDSHFYYLTGFNEPEAILVLDATAGRSILFCREKNQEREIWDGFRYGPDQACEHFGFDEAYPLSQLETVMPTLLAGQSALHYAFGCDNLFDQKIFGWLQQVRQQVRVGLKAPDVIQDIRHTLSENRLIKDASEIALMREAGRISGVAHERAMRMTRPEMYEYQIEAEILHTFASNGARYPAYESIVAGGANACVLHYVSNRDRLKDGDLLLIDAGCEFEGYAGDITRTFPVNGRFTPAQRAVYDIVLEAELAGIAAVQPGAAWNAPADAALRVLVQGLVDLKLLTGSVDGNIESESYRQFYMHRIGHWLGLDVHDVGDYKIEGQWRPFVPGMVTTIEPGLYIRPADNVPAEFSNIGIRIEDDVLVCADGHEVLSHLAPKTPEALEAMIGKGC